MFVLSGGVPVPLAPLCFAALVSGFVLSVGWGWASAVPSALSGGVSVPRGVAALSFPVSFWLSGGVCCGWLPCCARFGCRVGLGFRSRLRPVFKPHKGDTKSAFCIIGDPLPPITSPTRGYKTRILYKTGLCVSWFGCRGVGLPRPRRWSSLRCRFSGCSFGLSGLFGVWLCRGLVFGSRRLLPWLPPLALSFSLGF